MKIALAQLNIIYEDKEANIVKLKEMIKAAKTSYADMILFPEMTLTGFSMNISLTAEENDYSLNIIREIARSSNIIIAFGWTKKAGKKAENHYTVVGKNGELISDYIKIHPFSYSGEDKYFEAGSKLALFEIDNIRFSTFICYDLRFPEIFQAASSYSDVIIIAANWPGKRKDHWNTLLKARAIENQSYILAVNCEGMIGDLSYSGDSSVYSPDGSCLSRLEDIEDIAYIDISYENVKENVYEYRAGFPVKKDRKTDLYKSLY